MIAAQAKNKDQKPMIGLYTFGCMWCFLVLEGKEYAKTKNFDATQDDIYEIVKMLKWAKKYILSLINK
ncbi:MAG: hypothetical protein EAZ97_04410 [Bacteroidetes bacterium]|nr:MAG: hypothetical protein EAZ97_04410 [Bacteroidota bacterium]